MKLRENRHLVTKITKSFKVSHLFCLSIGALIPIYADVLFLHEFNSSTVSAIMDTVMAIAAVSAALSVRNWLKDKMKSKGFDQTHQIISDLYSMVGIYSRLEVDCRNFAKSYFDGMDLGISDEIITRDAKVIAELSNKTNEKVLEMTISIKSLPIWNINCKAEKEFIAFLKEISSFCDVVDSVINIVGQPTFAIRKQTWLEKKEVLKTASEKVMDHFHSFDKSYDKLFSYEPLKIDIQ